MGTGPVSRYRRPAVRPTDGPHCSFHADPRRMADASALDKTFLSLMSTRSTDITVFRPLDDMVVDQAQDRASWHKLLQLLAWISLQDQISIAARKAFLPPRRRRDFLAEPERPRGEGHTAAVFTPAIAVHDDELEDLHMERSSAAGNRSLIVIVSGAGMEELPADGGGGSPMKRNWESPAAAANMSSHITVPWSRSTQQRLFPPTPSTVSAVKENSLTSVDLYPDGKGSALDPSPLLYTISKGEAQRKIDWGGEDMPPRLHSTVMWRSASPRHNPRRGGQAEAGCPQRPPTKASAGCPAGKRLVGEERARDSRAAMEPAVVCFSCCFTVLLQVHREREDGR
nr:unnamed protein product [Digitaria exilis]